MNAIADKKTISAELCGFLRANVLAASVECDESTSLRDLGMDSFAMIELILFVERQYLVSIPDSHLTRDNLDSALSLATCVRRLLESKDRPQE